MSSSKRALVGQHIESLKPYVPGKPIEELERELGIEGAIKLASNENPLGPSPLAMEAIEQAIKQVHFYPDGAAHSLKAAISRRLNLPHEELAIGNGSNELLTLVARTFCMPNDHAVISDYSFIAYRVIMQAEGMRWDSVPTLAGFETDLDAMLEAITSQTRVVFVANPNNPTGTYLKAEALRAFLAAVPEEVIVVVDEAYHEYVQADDYDTALNMRQTRERLLVMRTFSKVFGLGGMRIGFAVGPPALIDYLNRVREPFNCGLLAQKAAAAAFFDDTFIARSVEVNEQGRAYLEAHLSSMAARGVSWTPSQTNFLLIHTPHSGPTLYDALLHQGVIVRPMGPYALPQSLRVTIGTLPECERFIQALDVALTQLEA